MPRAAKKLVVPPAKAERKLERPKYKSFRLSQRIKHPKRVDLKSRQILGKAIRLLLTRKRFFAGILAVYALLNLLMVTGFNQSVGVVEVKPILSEVFGTGGTGQITTSLTLFSALLGSVGSAASDVASTYQTILIIVTSLALIWGLRQAKDNAKLQIRDAFYKGMYPLVPFILVLLTVLLQLLPIVMANGLYSYVLMGGLAVTVLEKALWIMLLFLIYVFSLYMITSSIFALYVVTLPEVRPLQALRSARELVRYRRWTIMRKVIFLPFALLILLALINVPIIYFITPAAEIVFYSTSILAMAVAHAYMYTLYRELL